MNYNPNIHNRRSIRLKGYDYSRAGLYFITICCQDQAMMFGCIANDQMILNDAGRMVEKWYWELENKYPDKKCHQMVVMPNHFHCIIENLENDEIDNNELDSNAPPQMDTPPRIDAHVGTSLRGRPEPTGERGRPEPTSDDGNHKTYQNTNESKQSDEVQNDQYGQHNQKIKSTLGEAIGWFKTMTTNAYIKGVKNKNWPRYNQRLWQRNYYEHIIRNPQAYSRISNYIINNPAQWAKDKFHE
ncbi:MAG: hypothetical protein WD530_01100 [Vicingaceae bacterium]